MASNKAWSNAGKKLAMKGIGKTIGEIVKSDGMGGFSMFSAALTHPNDFKGNFGSSPEFKLFCKTELSPRPELFTYNDAINAFYRREGKVNEKKYAANSTMYDDEVSEFREVAITNAKHLRGVLSYIKHITKKTQGCKIIDSWLIHGSELTIEDRFDLSYRKNYCLDFCVEFQVTRIAANGNCNQLKFCVSFKQAADRQKDIAFENQFDAMRYIARAIRSECQKYGAKNNPFFDIFNTNSPLKVISDFSNHLKDKNSKKPKGRLRRLFGAKK